MTLPELPPPWRHRAIIVAGNPDEAWFAPEELAEASRFSLPKRKREWMLSRFAAKRLALEQRLESDPRRCLIKEWRLGSRYVSLSHSNRYGAAAIDASPVGIDIEVIRPISERAAHFFLSEDEADVMRACALEHRLLHFWCAKEAAWKQRGGEIETLRRLPLHLQSESGGGLQFEGVETVQLDDLVIALTRPIS